MRLTRLCVNKHTSLNAHTSTYHRVLSNECIDWMVDTLSLLLAVDCCIWVKKQLKPSKFLMGKPSQNYGVSPKYGVTQFHLQPDISEHTPP